jgi:hypothetical protein
MHARIAVGFDRSLCNAGADAAASVISQLSNRLLKKNLQEIHKNCEADWRPQKMPVSSASSPDF